MQQFSYNNSAKAFGSSVVAKPAGSRQQGPDSAAGPYHKTHIAGSNLTVMIVEDERIVAENLRLILEDQKVNVTGIVASGEEAVRVAQLTSPDVVLMDIRIQGDLDGIQAAILIQNVVLVQPRILFISAHAKETFPHLHVLKPGTFSYLRKPYSPEDLMTAIDVLINNDSKS